MKKQHACITTSLKIIEVNTENPTFLKYYILKSFLAVYAAI